MDSLLKYLLPIWLAALPLFLQPPTLAAQQQSLAPLVDSDLQTATPSVSPTRPPLIVIGFAGGFIRRTNTVHGEIALALQLSKEYGTRIHTEIFENHHGNQAHREILRLLHLYNSKPSSSSAAGTAPAPSSSEPTQVPRIILYGHSWGASEAVAVARRLQHDGIPVQLLAEVDGVPKRQQDDSIVPSNVAQAINFYQDEGLLHGRATIHAANPRVTHILGNVHLSYKHHDVACTRYPWFARTFMHRHIEIENDPRVWNQIEALILSNLPSQSQPKKDPATTPTASTRAL